MENKKELYYSNKDFPYKLWILGFCLIAISMIEIIGVHANSLTVLNNNTINVSKIYNTNQDFIFTLQNQEPQTFYNITFITNDFVTMPMISTLTSGQIINVTATAKGNSNFKGSLEIAGYYVNNVGITNSTHVINVSYDNGLSDCSLTFIRGDKVIFVNQVPDDVQLFNKDTNVLVTTIGAGQNYTSNFDSPAIFHYAFLRRGLQFAPATGGACTIISLDDQGYVNNPGLDAWLNLSILVGYNPTSLTSSFLETNYTVDFFGTSQGVFTLKNTGSEIAHNISITGDWFGYSPDYFDLNPGETKAVIYTIKPQVSNTNQTNQTYAPNITISGNFPTIIQTMTVFVNYAIIDNGNLNNSNGTTFKDWLCKNYPEYCNPNANVIYKYLNGSDGSFNVTFQQDQVRQMLGYMFTLGDSWTAGMNYLKSQLTDANNNITSLNSQVVTLKAEQDAQKAEALKSNNNWFFVFLLIGMLVIGCLTFVIITQWVQKNKQERIDKEM